MEQARVEILFADDDAAMREMVGEVLRTAGFAVRIAGGGREALESIRTAPPTLAVLDYRMGTPNGLEVCRTLKAEGRTAHIPVLILTGQSSVEDRIDSFDAGADDYLAKPFDARELLARVRALLRQVERSLHRNPTTGLPGGDAIELEFERRRGDTEGFACCYFDLDHFKPFSDRFGFAVADRTIRLAGAALTVVAGDDGFVGHVGGDDFVLLCGRDDAVRRCQQVRERFMEGVRSLIPEEALRDGSYEAIDRDGERRLFPITRLSAAVVLLPPGTERQLGDLGEMMAEAKRQAKSSAETVVVELDA